MTKKSVLKLGLTVIKYLVTLALGYLAGDPSVINPLID